MRQRRSERYSHCLCRFFRFFRREKHKKCQEKTHCRLLGKIIKGYGNNGKDRTEGVRYKNAFCTYSHGPVLPKNPAFADTLIETALKRKYGTCRTILKGLPMIQS